MGKTTNLNWCRISAINSCTTQSSSNKLIRSLGVHSECASVKTSDRSNIILRCERFANLFVAADTKFLNTQWTPGNLQCKNDTTLRIYIYIYVWYIYIYIGHLYAVILDVIGHLALPLFTNSAFCTSRNECVNQMRSWAKRYSFII